MRFFFAMKKIRLRFAEICPGKTELRIDIMFLILVVIQANKVLSCIFLKKDQTLVRLHF